MIGTDLLPLLVAVGCVVVAGLIASLEVALSTVSRVRAGELARDGRPGALRLQTVLADPPRSLNLLLLLRLAAELTAVGIVTAYALDRVGGSWAVALAVVIMLLVSYVLVGVAPRTLGRQRAEPIGLVGAPIVLALAKVFGPLPQLLILLGNALTPGKGFREGPFASEAELRDLVDIAQEAGVVEQTEREMIGNVFELSDTLVREVMVPRTDMVIIEQDKTVRQALNLTLRSGFSRVPVVGEGGTDDVLGVTYLRDLVSRERVEGGGDQRVEQAMRRAVFVPDSKPVDDLLREMQTSLGHLAIVVDEYGGTAGLVTMEDVLEEIVGEIVDEFDNQRLPVELLEENVWRVTARLPVEDLEELVGTDLARDRVDTVGGLLASLLGMVPIPGATVEIDRVTLVAETAAGRRNQITTVLVRLDPAAPSEEPTEQDAP